MKTTLLLVRHGESLGNKEKFFAGHMDVPLIDSGIRQAECSAQYVKEHYQVDAIYASDLMRAYRTAECFATLLGLDITKDSGLREIHAGEWEGKKHEDLPKLYPEEYGKTWLNNTGKAVCPGGESVKELGDRIIKALEKIAKKHPGETVLIATHSTPVRVAHSIVAYGSVDSINQGIRPTNASITEITYENGKWQLVHACINEHLKEFQTADTNANIHEKELFIYERDDT